VAVKNQNGGDKAPNSELRTPNPISLHIEELILEGFGAGDRHRIADSLGCALERLLLSQGVPAELAESREVETINARPFDVMPHAKPEAIGSQVAQAIYRGLMEGEGE
jgi:hypothetical protein